MSDDGNDPSDVLLDALVRLLGSAVDAYKQAYSRVVGAGKLDEETHAIAVRNIADAATLLRRNATAFAALSSSPAGASIRFAVALLRLTTDVLSVALAASPDRGLMVSPSELRAAVDDVSQELLRSSGA